MEHRMYAHTRGFMLSGVNDSLLRCVRVCVWLSFKSVTSNVQFHFKYGVNKISMSTSDMAG